MSTQELSEGGTRPHLRNVRSFAKWPLVLAVGLTSTGCFSYRQTDMSLVPQGSEVELMVTRDGSEAVARVTESNTLSPIVRGQIMGREDGTVLLRVPVRTNADAASRVRLGQMVAIPELSVLSVGQREFNVGKTVLLMGGAAAVGTLLLIEVFDAVRDGGGDRSDQTNLSIGILRFAVP